MEDSESGQPANTERAKRLHLKSVVFFQINAYFRIMKSAELNSFKLFPNF